MFNKTWLFVVIVLLLFGCNNGQIDEAQYLLEEDFNPLPKVNLSYNKSISIKISECNFDVINPERNTKYKSSISDGKVKILLGSNLTCDYKDGVFIKEIINTSDTLKVEIYQKGSKLSNECNCYFYYEITLKNKTKFPDYITVGNKVYTFDMQNPLSNNQLEDIEKKLKD